MADAPGRKIDRVLRWTIVLIRLGVGAVFVWAGITKIHELAQFTTDVASFGILPGDAPRVVAYWLPWLEIFTGVFFAIGPMRRGAAAVLLAMLAVYVIALISAGVRGIPLTCGCFGGVGDDNDWHLAVGRDLILIGLVFLTLLPRQARVSEGGEAAARQSPREPQD